MSQSSLSFPDELNHYGVKGQKWGVRRDKGHEGQRVSNRKLRKLDKKYELENTGVKGFVSAQNAMADKVNPQLNVLNNNPKYKGKLLNGDTKLVDAYFNDYKKIVTKAINDVNSERSVNPSGTAKYVLVRQGEREFTWFDVVRKDISHADETDPFENTKVVLTFDNSGHITDQKLIKKTLTVQHGLGTELSHYGVKGQKWGVRRAINPRTRRVKATPGRSTGTRPELSRVTNEELQRRINRLNMEKQYSSLLRENELRTNWKLRAAEYTKKFLLGQANQELSTDSMLLRQTGRNYVMGAFTK